MTSTARVRAYRARQASEGKSEVRGIYAKPERHPAIKAAVKQFDASWPFPQYAENGKRLMPPPPPLEDALL